MTVVSCPVPLGRHTTIQLAHGAGGRLTRELVEHLFLPRFDSASLRAHHDCAVLPVAGARIAFTTDSYVVEPRFFPGGDLGQLAVFGTVNDLAMAGARPAYLSAGFILEEGLPIEELCRVVDSMQRAAASCGVELVTGDTKVVDRGKGDGVFVNTAGVGFVPSGISIAPARICPGDAVLLSGDVGRHGVAVLSVRKGLEFAGDVVSDCASLYPLVEALLAANIDVHCLRDATRGGLATALNELALDAGVGIDVEEQAIPISEGVAGACELLGLDPLYVACEGRMVAVVPAVQVERALAAMGPSAAHIGTVHPGSPPGTVVLETRLGSSRLLELLSGEQLPRIC